MGEKKVLGLFVPNIKMPKSCSDCPVKRYSVKTGDLFCIPLDKVVGNCIFDNDEGYVGDICIHRYEECPIQECYKW